MNDTTRSSSDQPSRPSRPRARRGSGMLYRQRRRDGSLGPTWWSKIYIHGRPVRESTGTEDRTAAEGILRDRLTRADQGLPVVRLHEVRFDELAADLTTHYETTGSRNLTEAEKRLAPLRRFFAGWRAARIDGAAFDRYVQKRQAGGTGNGTVNRERSVLLKMLRLALERGKLARLPVMRALKEPPPRQGFFEPEPYAAVRRRLASDLQVALDIAYTYGWRMQSEVLTLTRRQVDLAGGRLLLEAGTTKNGEGREVFLTPPLKAALAAQLARVDGLGVKLGRIIPSVFPHFVGAKVRTATTRGPVLGEQRADFRKAWLTACKNAGVAGRLRHDLRRTAVRNLVRAGVPERVSMELTGHKTRSVFDRYDIVSEADKRAASERLMGMISGMSGGRVIESRPASS